MPDQALAEAVSQSLGAADAVFAGRVERLETLPAGDSSPPTPWDALRVYFQVDDVWKGDVAATAVVFTAGSSASCGYPFEKDEEYLVYAELGSDGDLSASWCSRTSRLAAVSPREIEILNARLRAGEGMAGGR